jgi:transposase
MQSEEDALVMHVLYSGHGWPISKIAQEFGVAWRTARRYATSTEPPAYGPRACPAELSPTQLEHVSRRLAMCSSIRATTLLRELGERDMPFAGSYPSFARRIRLLRDPSRELDPVVRFETDAGVQLQVDWADCGLWPVGAELVELHALVAVLGYSRMVAVRFALDKTRQTTLRLLVELLHDLGGAPAEILTDRDPAFVIGSLSDGRAVFAPEWIDLAGTLGATPRACKPYRAKTKGKVERVIRELKEDFLVCLTGVPMPIEPAIEDYDRLARRWSLEVVAGRRHRTTGRIIAEAWATERAVLRPIPDRILHAASAQVALGHGSRATARSALSARSGGRFFQGDGKIRARQAGQVVQQRGLEDYEAAQR